jgi:putative component of membrane protein insertase Oxa1/YidC/SpoIIIJ protein YidD
MRILLLITIKLYWLLIPEKMRRTCLFKTSCSHYVFDKTKQEGLLIGLKSLKFRIRNCNPHYHIIILENEKVLISATQQVFKLEDLNESILGN